MCFTIEVHLTRKAIEQRFSVDTSALYDFDYQVFLQGFQQSIYTGNCTERSRPCTINAVGTNTFMGRRP